RRRHTRFSRDWSSDVCSSDLLFLIGLGAALPGWFTHETLDILPQIRRAIEVYDSGQLRLAAGALVILNTVRAVPIYVGAVLTAEALRLGQEGKNGRWIGWLTPLLVIPDRTGRRHLDPEDRRDPLASCRTAGERPRAALLPPVPVVRAGRVGDGGAA